MHVQFKYDDLHIVANFFITSIPWCSLFGIEITFIGHTNYEKSLFVTSPTQSSQPKPFAIKSDKPDIKVEIEEVEVA
ncbi:hypothetical protein BGX24_001299 [Mortierella sp. AD032]|nr:hypothetical protein BGX24_001299 [Mortierella sp. AD032]